MLHKALVDLYVYTVLEGLAEICPTLLRALTFTPTFPQINFVYGTPHRSIGKCTLRSLRGLSHDRWVPERDGSPNTSDLTSYVDMCCTTLGWRDARVYQRGSATCNRRNLFDCGPRNDAGCRDNGQTCPCYIPFHTDDNNNFSLETSH